MLRTIDRIYPTTGRDRNVVAPWARRLMMAAAASTATAIVLATIPAAAASPENGRIAFNEVSFDESSIAIFTVEPDGTDIQQLTDPGAGHNTAVPDWSPDGRWIAYQRGLWDRIAWHVMVMRADGTDHTDLTAGSCRAAVCSAEGGPDWSPNGGRIAFNRWDDNEVASIYVMRADGTHRHRVTHPPVGYEDDGYKSWSPGGSRLVFGRYSDRRDQEAVFIVHVDGTHLRQLTPWRTDAGHPDWSPNGRWISFDTHSHGGSQRICLIHPDGSGLRRITPAGVSWTRASFSPDGTMIAALRAPGEASENDVYVMELDGTMVQVVTASLSDERAEGTPGWGPLP